MISLAEFIQEIVFPSNAHNPSFTIYIGSIINVFVDLCHFDVFTTRYLFSSLVLSVTGIVYNPWYDCLPAQKSILMIFLLTTAAICVHGDTERTTDFKFKPENT